MAAYDFAEKLSELMKKANLTQSQLSKLTGIGASSISQYVSGKNEPTKKRKQQIALTLGEKEDYFEEPKPIIQSGENLSVKVAAKLMGKSPEWVYAGLRNGVFPWGYAVKLAEWSYFISPAKFYECTGINPNE